MDFGDVLTKAWKIIWKHKVLWIFGIMAGCARGGGGTSGGGGGSPSTGAPEMQRFFSNFGNWIAEHLWIVALVILVVLVLAVLSILLGTIGRIGLIRGTFKADGGAEKLAFGELFQESLPFFWRVFGLGLLFGLAFLIIAAPIIVLGVVTAGVALLCLLPVICILVPVALAAQIVVQQATSAIVIEGLGLVDGLRRGWDVSKKNIGPLLIIGLITIVIGFVVGIAIALPILIAVGPAAIAFAVNGEQPSSTLLIIGAVLLAVYLPILLVARGILAAYVESVWTLTYLRLTKPKESEPVPPALPANA